MQRLPYPYALDRATAPIALTTRHTRPGLARVGSTGPLRLVLAVDVIARAEVTDADLAAAGYSSIDEVLPGLPPSTPVYRAHVRTLVAQFRALDAILRSGVMTAGAWLDLDEVERRLPTSVDVLDDLDAADLVVGADYVVEAHGPVVELGLRWLVVAGGKARPIGSMTRSQVEIVEALAAEDRGAA